MAVHKQLSRQDVVRAAGELIAAEGVASFSVRQVAKRLDVSASSVMWHAQSREELLRAVVDDVVSSIALPDRTGVDPADWLRLAGTAIRRTLLREPELTPVVRDLMATVPATVDVLVSIAEVLELAGFSGEDLATAANAYLGYVFGYTLVQHAQDAATLSPSAAAALARRVGELAATTESPEVLRILTPGADAGQGQTGQGQAGRGQAEQLLDEGFTEGLDALLEGLASRALAKRAGRRGGRR